MDKQETLETPIIDDETYVVPEKVERLLLLYLLDNINNMYLNIL